MLISIRLLPLLVVSPIVFFARIPLTVRLMLSLTLAVVLASALPDRPAFSVSMPMIAGEGLLGAAMAFGFHAGLAGFDMAGRLVDTQMGLNAAGIFDPNTANITSIVADILALAFAVLFVSLDMHHALLEMFSKVLVVIPPGSVSVSSLLSGSLVSLLTQQFLLAFMMVVPVVLGLWLTDMAFAFLSRSMPQANIYFLALPIKLGLGTFLLVLTLPTIVQRIPMLFDNALRASAMPVGAL